MGKLSNFTRILEVKKTGFLKKSCSDIVQIFNPLLWLVDKASPKFSSISLSWHFRNGAVWSPPSSDRIRSVNYDRPDPTCCVRGWSGGRRWSSCRNPPEWRRNPRLYFFVMFSGRSRRCFDFYQKPQFAFGENRVERSSFWFGIRKCGSECVDHTHQMNQIWLCSRTVISHPDWKLASISKTVEEIFSGVG